MLIYAWINKKEHKAYIGKTNNLKNRIYQHWYSSKHSKKLNCFLQALNQYPNEEDWNIIILEDNISLEKVKERENYWIKYYNSIENGYNSIKSGASSPNKEAKAVQMRDKNNPNIIIQTFSSAYEAINFLEKDYTGAANILACCRGSRKTAYGYFWSYANDNQWMKKYQSFNNQKTGPKEQIIQMCDKNNHNLILKEFKNKDEIKKFLNRKNIGSIYANLKGTCKSGYGFFWKYKNKNF